MTDIDQKDGRNKECTQCGIIKPISEYGPRKTPKGNPTFTSQCKECSREYMRKRRALLPKKQRKKRPIIGRDMEKAAAYRKAYYKKNREILLEKARQYAAEFPEKKKARRKAYYEKNKDKENARSTEYARNNPDIVKPIARRTIAKQMSTPKGRLTISIRKSIGRGLIGGSKLNRQSKDLVNFTIDELRTHLEKQFKDGMSWQNYGRGKGKWSIDHIVPLAAHNYETPDDLDFKKAWALSNLQPLWNNENSAKGAKIVGAFQPSLAIAVNDNSQTIVQGYGRELRKGIRDGVPF